MMSEPKPTVKPRVSVAELCGQFDVRSSCGKCSKLKYVRCGECVSKQSLKRSAQISLTSSNTHTKGDNGQNVPKFISFFQNNHNKKTLDEVPSSSKFNMKSDNVSSSKTKNSHNVGKVGRVRNFENFENFNITPTKRKLLSEKQVTKLVPRFDSTAVLPGSVGGGDNSESPAKKTRFR